MPPLKLSSVIDTPLGRTTVRAAAQYYGHESQLFKKRLNLGWDILRVINAPATGHHINDPRPTELRTHFDVGGEQLSLDEIAAKLDLPVITVRNRINRHWPMQAIRDVPLYPKDPA